MRALENRFLARTTLAVFCAMAVGAQQNPGEDISVSYHIAPVITLHEPAVVFVRIANQLDRSISLDLGFNRKNGFRFAVIEPTGQRVELGPLREEGIDGGGVVRLGAKERYFQRLILDEWYAFEWPGDYRVEVRLETAIQTDSGTAIVTPRGTVLHVKVSPRDEAVLKKRCEALVRQLMETRSFPERSAIAEELSYIRDLVSIPYLARLVEEGEDYHAIAGLMRIGTDEAMEAMIPATQSKDVGSARYARGLLRQMLSKIQNPEIRKKVLAALSVRELAGLRGTLRARSIRARNRWPDVKSGCSVTERTDLTFISLPPAISSTRAEKFIGSG